MVLPRRARDREAARAVQELRPWIERRLRALAAASAAVHGPDGTVPYLSDTLWLEPQRGRSRVHRVGERLLVPAAEPGPAIERWYRRRARAEVEPRVRDAATALSVSPGPLTIRSQRTRWGSCAPSGALSFNWRLLLAPESVLDYVVWHEVCHLAVLDHSAQFWELVAQHFPDHREQSRWLRRFGTALSVAPWESRESRVAA